MGEITNTGITPVNLKDAIRNLDMLPAMPIITQKILALNIDSIEGELAMLKLIEQDPQIAAKIIGLANTPLFGASKRVSSISDSAMLLGFTRVKAVTMGIAFISSLISNPAGKLDIQGLWLHSLAIAPALRTLSLAMPRNTRPLDDEIFLAGLLYDIGYMVLNHLDQIRSDELHTRFSLNKDRPSIEIEAELLEMNHCELGAELDLWNLPEAIIAVLRYHHDPENEHASAGQPLVRMVNIAEKVLGPFGIFEHCTVDISNEEWQALGIDPDKADKLIDQINRQAEEVKQTAGSFL
ncbi:MAG: HDOD domain-containing protein [Candidatus Nitrotoga sp.]